MSGPVRKALEAAGEALVRPWPEFPTRGMTAEQQRRKAHELAAAAAIAAFLRALPLAWVRDKYGRDEAVFVGLLREMVEAAAHPADMARDMAREIDGETE